MRDRGGSLEMHATAEHVRSAASAADERTRSSAPAAIELVGATKDYGRGRGIFDVSFSVQPGEVVGFLGANGAGKTVTMRSLMGFIKLGAGSARIDGLDCFTERARIQATCGYLPGEVTCPPDMRGRDFIRFVADLKGIRDRARIDDLVERFELDLSARIGRMSKGTKQKVALVCAFMGAPRVLLLDEPTSGLDPLMQDRFADLVRAERRRGAAILLSSHVFPEVERVCDRVVFIRAGKLRGALPLREVQASRKRLFTVAFADAAECARYRTAHRLAGAANAGDDATATVEVAGAVDAFVKDLAGYRIADLTMREQPLEELFRHIYERDDAASPRPLDPETEARA